LSNKTTQYIYGMEVRIAITHVLFTYNMLKFKLLTQPPSAGKLQSNTLYTYRGVACRSCLRVWLVIGYCLLPDQASIAQLWLHSRIETNWHPYDRL